MLNHLKFCTFVFILLYTLKCTNSSIKFSTTGNCCNLEVATGKRFRRRSSTSSVIFDEDNNVMKWNKKNITYRITAYSEQLTKIFVDTEIAKAFRLWSAHADLEFIERNNSTEDVDINIKFCHGNHGDSTPFRTFDIAHAFAPEEELGGDIHFNSNFTKWNDGTTFLHTATHEIGHALGLHHIPLRYSVMSPYQGHAGFNVHLSLEDIRSIQALYGKKPSPYPPPPLIFDETQKERPMRTTTIKTTTHAPTIRLDMATFTKYVKKQTENSSSTDTPERKNPLDKFSTTTQASTTTTVLPVTFPTEVPTTTTLADVRIGQDLDQSVEGSGSYEISDTESEEDVQVFVESVTAKLSERPGEDGIDIMLEEKGKDEINGNSTLRNSISSVNKTPLLIIIPFCICFVNVNKNLIYF